MKTIPLRELVRSPKKVKNWTRAGASVRVTDNGNPLWIIRPDSNPVDDEARAKAIDEVLDGMLQDPISKVSVSDIILRSRE